MGILKQAWDSKKFREGLADEGIPLAGATLGAGIGAMYKNGLTGAALGYAAGGGASILRSKLRGEKPSESRRFLAAGALGYGAGGLTHAGISGLAHNAKPGAFRTALREGAAVTKRGKFLHGALEEGVPAIGATLGTGIAMGTQKKEKQAQIRSIELLLKTAGFFSNSKPPTPTVPNRIANAAKQNHATWAAANGVSAHHTPQLTGMAKLRAVSSQPIERTTLGARKFLTRLASVKIASARPNIVEQINLLFRME